MTSAAALRWTRSSLLVAAWTLIGGLAGLAVAHIVAFDSARPLLMANALSYWI